MGQRTDRSSPAIQRSVRAVCWIGVAVDAVAAIGFALPARSRLRRMILPAVAPNRAEHAAGSRSVTPLMAGWSLLLAWVARDPVSRRQPLLLTSVPVVAGLIAVETVDVRQGRASALRLAPVAALQLVLLALFGRAYHQARRLAARTAEGPGPATGTHREDEA